MNWSCLPPLSALRAFAAYAETGSVTAAGAVLNVTHAAISQQMRALEAHLGLPLLDRSGRSLSLTPEGEVLSKAVLAGFDTIALAVDTLTRAEDDRPLTITTTPTFAAQWLLPRLGRFRALAPELNLLIDPSPAVVDPKPGGIDLAIRFGTGTWAGLMSEPFLPAPVVLVAAPELFPDGVPDSSSEITGKPILEDIGNHETRSWFADYGLDLAQQSGVTQVPGPLLLDALRQGYGIAVTTRIVVEDDLEAGRLVCLHEDPRPLGYHLVTGPGVARPALRRCLAWLRSEGEGA